MTGKRTKHGTTIVTSGDYRGETLLTPGGDTHPMGLREKIAQQKIEEARAAAAQEAAQ